MSELRQFIVAEDGHMAWRFEDVVRLSVETSHVWNGKHLVIAYSKDDRIFIVARYEDEEKAIAHLRLLAGEEPKFTATAGQITPEEQAEIDRAFAEWKAKYATPVTNRSLMEACPIPCDTAEFTTIRGEAREIHISADGVMKSAKAADPAEADEPITVMRKGED